MDEGRRRFFKRAAVTVVTGGVVAAVGIDAARRGCTPREDETIERDWSFLDVEPDLSPAPWQVIERDCVPLGPKIPVPRGTELYRALIRGAMPAVRQKIEWEREKGRLLNVYPRITPTLQNFGIPEDPKVASALIHYCQLASKFLHEQIRGLDRSKDLAWTVIEAGDDYSQTHHKRGLIGRSFYKMHWIDVNDQDGNFLFKNGIAHHLSGSYMHHHVDPDTDPEEQWSVYIVPGFSAVVTPFSEIVPLSLGDSHHRHSIKVGYDEASKVSEALCEGLSYHLGHRISQELAIPNGSRLVDEVHQGLVGDPLYELVPSSVRWISTHSMQDAFDMYVEDPQEFARAIVKA